jgi:hypothetical protein
MFASKVDRELKFLRTAPIYLALVKGSYAWQLLIGFSVLWLLQKHVASAIIKLLFTMLLANSVTNPLSFVNVLDSRS